MLSEKTILAVVILKKSAADGIRNTDPRILSRLWREKSRLDTKMDLEKNHFWSAVGTWSRSLDSPQEKFTSFSRWWDFGNSFRCNFQNFAQLYVGVSEFINW